MEKTTYRDPVNGLIEQMVIARDNAEKFDNGNESAGRRARTGLMDIAHMCAEIRNAMLATTAGARRRKENEPRQRRLHPRRGRPGPGGGDNKELIRNL